MRIDVLADSDTRWKWGALLAGQLCPEGGAEVHAHLLRGRATPTGRQLAEVGVVPASLRETTVADFLAEAGAGAGTEAAAGAGAETGPGEADVVVLALVGGGVQALLHGLARAWHGRPRRPVLVTGYVGVVYEKVADGLLLRAGADVVLANSAFDARRFRDLYGPLGIDTGSVVRAALPFLAGDVDRYRPSENRPFTVCFAAQPSVPEPRDARLHLLERCARHAELHPERRVLVKLRSRPGEHTTHLEEHPYQRLVARLGRPLPVNCELVYGNMGDILDRTDLLVTVSSTAALESLRRGIPTAVLRDAGVRESLGNHYFTGSGCIASWDQLDAGHLPAADPEWLRDQGVDDPAPYEGLRKRVAELRGLPALPPPTPYYTPGNAPAYLPGILARYGLASDGTPLPTAASTAGGAAGPRRAVRRVLAQGARGAYRMGVQHVAPAIRRWGQL
ncbi:DUF6716 putative glycosyltransferase [Peterkaempfera bronchialis]|uniref:DUF6716 putative glycosyltransferase n=1 Tax=Peterkaempfera bronchialis TaxID=2126346 RepID=UPI003C30C261